MRRSGAPGAGAGRGTGARAASGPPSIVNWNGTASSTFSRMASKAGLSVPDSGMASPYAARWIRVVLGRWRCCRGAGYGIFLITVALRVPVRRGTDRAVRAAARRQGAAPRCCWRLAALRHPVAAGTALAGRRADRVSAAGDYLLAMPWWEPSFVLGLASFLIAHLCFLAALVPLVRRQPARLRGRGRRGAGLRGAAGVVLAGAARAGHGAAGDRLHGACSSRWCVRRCWPTCRRRGPHWVRCASRSRIDDRDQQVRAADQRRWRCRSGGPTRRR